LYQHLTPSLLQEHYLLVDEEKKRLFADLARAHNYSMGWLLNQAIDKMLEAGTIYI
jgi:hypothetical protein